MTRRILIAMLLIMLCAQACDALIGVDPDSPKAQRARSEGVPGTVQLRLCFADSAAALLQMGSYDATCPRPVPQE